MSSLAPIGQTKNLGTLLRNKKFAVDHYQREYAWGERQVEELINDLSERFLRHYRHEHARSAVERYAHYFLGPIITCRKNKVHVIVDGQQRLTTLTLLFLYLHHLQSALDESEKCQILDLIYSTKFGKYSYNLDVTERNVVMDQLREGTEPTGEETDTSRQNMLDRYRDISECFPASLQGKALPYFIDWLTENVHVVEIETSNDEDAYTIFETMNDRGLRLSLPDMLKGYFIANVTDDTEREQVNTLWKSRMFALSQFGKDAEVDFFKHWLRGRYANTFTFGSGDTDYERIGSEFHRWVRDNEPRLQLTSEPAFVSFIKEHFACYADTALKIHKAANNTQVPKWESVRYNAQRNFTLQHQLLLAAVTVDDDPAATKEKIALVARFLDIWLARRVWNSVSNLHTSVRSIMFTFTKEIRQRTSIDELRAYLLEQLHAQEEQFTIHHMYGLNKRNKQQVRHMLNRITYWVEQQAGGTTHYEDFCATKGKTVFDIEHILSNNDRVRRRFNGMDFDEVRNYIGGLLLLPSSVNKSLADREYKNKLRSYRTTSQNVLAQSLDADIYQNNPPFRKFLETTGLEFEPYGTFTMQELERRQHLYCQIAGQVWNPASLTESSSQPEFPLAS